MEHSQRNSDFIRMGLCVGTPSFGGSTKGGAYMKKDTEKGQPLTQNWITEEIELAHRQGIPASINGVLHNSGDEAYVPLLLEQGTYMEDFVNDEYGNIVQINFDRIRH